MSDHENLADYELARQDELNRLSREERLIHAKVSRRAFVGATAAATLASLVGYEPKRLHAAGQESPTSGPRSGATADAVIVLWMAGGMAHTETFDPKRYTAFENGLQSERSALARFLRSTPSSTTSSSRQGSNRSRR